MHEQRTVDDGAPELGGEGARAAASPAWEWLEQQIDWYDQKSDYNQRWFKGLKLLQIVTAAAIPVAAAASAPAWLMGAGGAVIVIFEGVQQLEQYQQNWTAYRSTCESLKHERFLFISYRREETSAHAGRLYDTIAAEFGDGNVFMDVDLAPGIDFVERITDVVAACHVLIVVMGPRWSTVQDEDGAVRIADPEDFVRLEVETALRRADVNLIPVLVSGAEMPDRDDLPPEVQPLTRRNAIEISDGRWRYDVGRLMSRLKELLVEATGIHPAVPSPTEQATPPELRAQPTPAVQSSPLRILVEGVLVAAVIGLVAGGLANALPQQLSDFDQVLKRVGIWTPVAIGIAIWLTVRFGQPSIVRHLLLALVLGASAAALSGVITFYPTDQQPSDLAVKAPSYAVIGFALGALMGTLWVPRRIGTGMSAGIVAGLVVGLVVPAGQGAPVLWVTVRAIGIIGGTLIGLLAVERRATTLPPLQR